MASSTQSTRVKARCLQLVLGIWAVGVILSCPTAASGQEAVLKRIETEKREIKKQLDEAIADRYAEREESGPNGETPDARIARLEFEYRQAITAEIIARSRSEPDVGVKTFINQANTAKQEKLQRVEWSLAKGLAHDLREADSDDARQRVYKNYEHVWRIARTEADMYEEAFRRNSPLYEIGISQGTRRGTDNRTRKRLEVLADRIVDTRIEDVRTLADDPHDHEAMLWRRKLRRSADIDEYVRLARGGLVVDPETGQPVTGIERRRIARNSEEYLEQRLRDKAVPKSTLRAIIGQQDSRHDEADKIRSRLDASYEYAALDYITPGKDPSMTEVFRGMAGAVRHHQDKIHELRNKMITDGGALEGKLDPDNPLYHWYAKWRTGLGTASRIGDWGLTDDKESLEAVDARIATFQRRSDAAVEAFNAASREPDPSKLSTQHQDLLKSYGWIRANEDGTATYTLPSSDSRLAAMRERVNIPGAHWLDVVSAKNATRLLVSIYGPQAAAGRVGSLLEGLGAGRAATTAGVTAADTFANVALDAGVEYLERGKVEGDKLALESIFLPGAIRSVSKASGPASKGLAKVLTENPTARKEISAWAAKALGLTSEAALMSYYQGHVQGTGMSEDEFLANVANGLMARGAQARGHARGSGVRSKVAERLPEWMQRYVDPELRQHIQTAAREHGRRFNEVQDRFNEVTGGGSDIKKVTDALERGELSFENMKLLYTSNPQRYEGVMQGVIDRRKELFKGLADKATKIAHDELYWIRDKRRAEIEQQYARDPDRRKTELEKLEKWFKQEETLILTPAKAPGSSNLTSDIDRTVQSTHVLKHLKRLTDQIMPSSEEGKLGPTSAKAYDVNEYIDVMRISGRALPHAERMRDHVVRTIEGEAVTHGEAVQANSLATAMLHMTPAQRAQFRRNLLDEAKTDADRALLKRQFAVANDGLLRGELELREKIEELSREHGADPDDPDTAIRARDMLYGRRTEKLRKLEFELSQIKDPDSPEAMRLRSEIERGWNEALREGIEAYTDFTGLDMIVKRGQIGGHSIRDLINDPSLLNRTEDGVAHDHAANYSDKQLDGAINDQIRMMMHHINDYNQHHETATEAASALGKYAERALLAFKLKNIDITKPPYAKLNEWAERLVKNRKDPEELQKALEELGKGNLDQGMLAFNKMIEEAVPQMKGLTGATRTGEPPPESEHIGDPALTGVRNMIANRLERDREIEHQRMLYGSEYVNKQLEAEQAMLEKDLAEKERELARRERLGKRYLRKDWPRAEQLERELESIEKQIEFLPGESLNTPVSKKLREKRRHLQSQLEALHGKFVDAGGEEEHPDDLRLRGEVAAMKRRGRELADALKKEAPLLAAERKRREEIRPFSPGRIDPWLKLAKTEFKPGQSIIVEFGTPSSFTKYAWIGLVPADTEHGDEDRNRYAADALQSVHVLGGRRGGTMTLIAPSPGQYDVRMHDHMATGSEVAFSSITVIGHDPGLHLEKRTFETGEPVLLGFGRPSHVGEHGWVALAEDETSVQAVASDRKAGITWRDLPEQLESGVLRFTAPEKAGSYKFILFDDLESPAIERAILKAFEVFEATEKSGKVEERGGAVDGPATIVSDFEAGNDGWTALTTWNRKSFDITNEKGALKASDPTPNENWVWKAPEKFLGKRGEYLGLHLTYRICIDGTDDEFTDHHVMLRDRVGNVLTIRLGQKAGRVWTDFVVWLHPDAGWIDQQNNGRPSLERMRFIMDDLETLQIRGEFINGDDTCWLDDVRLGRLQKFDNSGWIGLWYTNRGDFEIARKDDRLEMKIDSGLYTRRFEWHVEILWATERYLKGRHWTSDGPFNGTFTWELQPGNRLFNGKFSENLGQDETRRWSGQKR